LNHRLFEHMEENTSDDIGKPTKPAGVKAHYQFIGDMNAIIVACNTHLTNLDTPVKLGMESWSKISTVPTSAPKVCYAILASIIHEISAVDLPMDEDDAVDVMAVAIPNTKIMKALKDATKRGAFASNVEDPATSLSVSTWAPHFATEKLSDAKAADEVKGLTNFMLNAANTPAGALDNKLDGSVQIAIDAFETHARQIATFVADNMNWNGGGGGGGGSAPVVVLPTDDDSWPIDWNIGRVCSELNLPIPCDFVLFIPHQRWRTGSTVVLDSNGLGATNYGHQKFEVSVDNAHYMLLAHFVIKLRAIVTAPEQVVVMRNTMIHKYMGGLNPTRIFPHQDKVQTVYREQGRTLGFSLFSCLVRPGWECSDDVLSLTGCVEWPKTSSEDLATGFWPRSTAYRKYWGWKIPLDHLNTAYAQRNRRAHNVTCFRFQQLDFRPIGNGQGEWGKVTVNRGHLGKIFAPGCADVRNGTRPFYPDTPVESIR
jgi:hypothetical protein